MTLHIQKLSTLIAVACTCGCLYVTQANAAKLDKPLKAETPIIGDTIAACESLNEGQLRYRDSKLQICSGGAWQEVVTIPPPKVVFVTSLGYTGALGGVGGADEICNIHALGAELKGTFKAWISVSIDSGGSTSVVQPADSFTKSAVPYVLVNGTVVADNWMDLTDGELKHAINIDELGYTWEESDSNDPNLPFISAWSTTDSDGLIYLFPTESEYFDCGHWLDDSTFDPNNPVWGALGYTNQTNTSWSIAGQYPCSTEQRLYCFEQ